MKKQIARGLVVVAVAMCFSLVFGQQVYAADKSHNVTIINSSTSSVSPVNAQQTAALRAVSSCNPSGTTVACTDKGFLNVPNNLAAGQSVVLTFTGPEQCQINSLVSYWKVGQGSGKIMCNKVNVNTCNSAVRDFICTITNAETTTTTTGNKPDISVTIQ